MTFRHPRFLLVIFVVAAQLLALPSKGETWFVRADGGSRYSPKATAGQCDGKTDAAYAGKGTNRHCAFSDMRYLWDDQATYNHLQWVIAGGDTVILDNSKAWRIGFDSDGRGGEKWCVGWDPGPYGCFNPPIPAGTAAQHTRILGRNFGHCNKGDTMDPAKMTQIFGGHATQTALNLKGTQFVDVECLEITRHSSCITHGYPQLPRGCSSSPPLDDFDGDGIQTDVSTKDVLLQDLWIHGHTDRGIIGPIGGTVIANRVDIAYNGMAGWDFDDGRGTPNVNAALKFTHSIIEWSGCNQEYPITHANPAASCYGQSNGGYGDGIGTPANDGLDVEIDHSIFRYNVQDGEDFGHVDTGSHRLSITNSLAYGNGGGQFKWGPNFTSVVFVNNIAVGNCMRMAKPIPGTPESFNAHLGDFCRAFDGISFSMRQGGSALLDNNTVVSYAPTTFDVSCASDSCSNATILFRNNIVWGIDNPATYSLGGKPGGPGFFYFEKPVGRITRSNNLLYGLRGLRCGTSEICKDPQFVAQPRFAHEGDLDEFNARLAASSPARRAGMRLPDLHTDFDGKPRPATGNYDLGALQE